MNVRWMLALAAVGSWLALAEPVQAETKVTISDTHLCCGGCVKGVEKALGKLEGVTFKCDQDESTIAVTAVDDAAAQKAIDALCDAGYHGKLDNAALKLKANTGAKENVKRLELTGVHNCCGACNRDIKAAVKSVPGVTADTAASKQTTFVVEGDFSPAAVLEALFSAGFHAKVKQ